LNSGANFEGDDHILDAEYDKIGDEGRRLFEQMMEMYNIVEKLWLVE